MANQPESPETDSKALVETDQILETDLESDDALAETVFDGVRYGPPPPALPRIACTKRGVASISSPARTPGLPPSSAAPMERLPRVGEIVGGHYRLVRLLGQGMFGRVFVAERVDVPAHHVALKVVPREVYTGRDVERELVMLAAASHPNIVQLKDHGTTADYVWLTMPVYEGETLGERLRRELLTPREAYDIFLPIARALDALHEAGLRHQDIKPDNIFLAVFAGQLHPVLLDLGVAAECNGAFVGGTVLYASPEQVAAFSESPIALPLTDRMDTYCLAATLLMALVGPAHYPGEGAESYDEMVSAQELRADHPFAYGTLPSVQGRPRELFIEAFRRWLDLDPNRRPTVARMADELQVLLEPERETERAATRRVVRQRRMRRAALFVTLGATVLGGTIAYSKRELLRVAGELGRARAEGAASFDQLDTCVASHQMAQREAQTCRDERSREQAECRAALERAVKPATGPDRPRELALDGLHAAKLKACEEQILILDTSYRAAQDRLIDCSRHEAEMAAAQTESRRLLETRASEIERCRSDLALCEHRAVSAAPSPPTALGARSRRPPSASRNESPSGSHGTSAPGSRFPNGSQSTSPGQVPQPSRTPPPSVVSPAAPTAATLVLPTPMPPSVSALSAATGALVSISPPDTREDSQGLTMWGEAPPASGTVSTDSNRRERAPSTSQEIEASLREDRQASRLPHHDPSSDSEASAPSPSDVPEMKNLHTSSANLTAVP